MPSLFLCFASISQYNQLQLLGNDLARMLSRTFKTLASFSEVSAWSYLVSSSIDFDFFFFCLIEELLCINHSMALGGGISHVKEYKPNKSWAILDDSVTDGQLRWMALFFFLKVILLIPVL